MRAILKTKLLSAISTTLFIFSISEAHAEKIKLVCNLEQESVYPDGSTVKTKEKNEVDIETFDNVVFATSNGINISFIMASAPSTPTEERKNYSDENAYEIEVRHIQKNADDINWTNHLKIDRNSGTLYYKSLGISTVTATGTCSKLDLKKRAF